MLSKCYHNVIIVFGPLLENNEWIKNKKEAGVIQGIVG
jgi:hypothetical protein